MSEEPVYVAEDRR